MRTNGEAWVQKKKSVALSQEVIMLNVKSQNRKGQRGFTLIELMTVAAIMAILSAIVFPAVTGTTATSRESTQSVDINAVQTGVDRYNQDTGLNASAAFAAIAGGDLPAGTATGTGTSGDPYVFTDLDITGVDFGVLDFDYLRNLPDHATEVITVASSGTSAVIRIVRGGNDVYVQLSNTTGGSLDFPAWGLNGQAVVWSFIDANVY